LITGWILNFIFFLEMLGKASDWTKSTRNKKLSKNNLKCI
jgi:hypothetical protein